MKIHRHRFPLLNGSESDSVREKAEDDSLFQPIFFENSTELSDGAYGSREVVQKALQAAHDKGYAEGIQAGRRAGTHIADQTLAPVLERFAKVQAEIISSLPRSAHLVVTQGHELAQAFVKKILGVVDSSAEDIDGSALKEELIEKIAGALRLSLLLNRDDMESLGQMARVNGIRWPDGDRETCMQADADQLRGQIAVRHHMDELQPAMEAAAALLPSTK